MKLLLQSTENQAFPLRLVLPASVKLYTKLLWGRPGQPERNFGSTPQFYPGSRCILLPAVESSGWPRSCPPAAQRTLLCVTPQWVQGKAWTRGQSEALPRKDWNRWRFPGWRKTAGFSGVTLGDVATWQPITSLLWQKRLGADTVLVSGVLSISILATDAS